MVRAWGILFLLGSLPFRWLTVFADAIDEPWDVHDPFLSGDGALDDCFSG